MDKDLRISELEYKVSQLEAELQATKEHLKRYTSPANSKEYYEKNKEQILTRQKLNPTSAEKRKEYNKISYLRKKEKLAQEKKESV